MNSLYTIRKRLSQIESNETIFFFVHKHMVVLTTLMGDLYSVNFK
jgi:hypothetical protein